MPVWLLGKTGLFGFFLIRRLETVLGADGEGGLVEHALCLM